MRVPYYYSIYQKKYKYADDKHNGVDNLNLTSLLDVLIILLFFLLMSYNPTELEFNAMSGINPPYSDSLEMGSMVTVIQVRPNLDVYLEKENLGNLGNSDSEEAIATKLATAFKAQEEKYSKKSNKQNAKAVNFIIDGKIKYEHMERIMLLAAQTGFDSYKFLVRAKSTKQ